MPKLVVRNRQYTISDIAAAPLVRADVLYWDTTGESMPRQPHLRLNPQARNFGRLEKAVYRNGIKALPTAREAFMQAKLDPEGHPLAYL